MLGERVLISANTNPEAVREYRALYGKRYIQGIAFQTYVNDLREICGKPLIHYTTTAAEQISIGESIEGYEVKYDSRSWKTGNFAFETHERAGVNRGQLVPSGLWRGDNTTTLIQGNMHDIFYFDAEELRKTLEAFYKGEINPPGWRKDVAVWSYGNITSKLILVPVKDILRLKMYKERHSPSDELVEHWKYGGFTYNGKKYDISEMC